MVCTANNVATAARRTVSAAHTPAAAGRSAERTLSSGCNPASEATTPTASSRRSSEAGNLRSLPGTPLATIEASRMASPAHTHSATAAPPHPPAADNQLRKRIPAGAEPENDRSDRPLHRIAPFRHTGHQHTVTEAPWNTEPKVPPAATGQHELQAGRRRNTGMSNVIGIAGLPDCVPGSRWAPNAQRGRSAVVRVRQVDGHGELLKAIGLDELLLCRCPGGKCE